MINLKLNITTQELINLVENCKNDYGLPNHNKLTSIIDNALNQHQQALTQVRRRVTLNQSKIDRKTGRTIIPLEATCEVVKESGNMLFIEYKGETHAVNKSSTSAIMNEI